MRSPKLQETEYDIYLKNRKADRSNFYEKYCTTMYNNKKHLLRKQKEKYGRWVNIQCDERNSMETGSNNFFLMIQVER